MLGKTFGEEWAETTADYERAVDALLRQLEQTALGRLIARGAKVAYRRRLERFRRRVRRHIPWFSG